MTPSLSTSRPRAKAGLASRCWWQNLDTATYLGRIAFGKIYEEAKLGPPDRRVCPGRSYVTKCVASLALVNFPESDTPEVSL